MQVVIAPDVLVNASIALGSAPQQVVDRLLSEPGAVVVSEWVLTRTAAMLKALPEFKEDAVAPHIARIRELVRVEGDSDFTADAWKDALLAAAKAGNATQVLTDHPDLVALDPVDGVVFLATDAYLIEASIPPPPPPVPGS